MDQVSSSSCMFIMAEASVADTILYLICLHSFSLSLFILLGTLSSSFRLTSFTAQYHIVLGLINQIDIVVHTSKLYHSYKQALPSIRTSRNNYFINCTRYYSQLYFYHIFGQSTCSDSGSSRSQAYFKCQPTYHCHVGNIHSVHQ